ncbi:MAG: glycosyltransferase [Pyrobaculum sp.]
MISALIFSMNEVEEVTRLTERLKGYVDEIVIVDSSDREKFEELKRRLPYARIYWLPPIGMADLYYKIGLELCKGEYILHLDGDEEPSEELLKDLRQIVKRGRVFAIKRVDPGEVVGVYLFRLFHRDHIVPNGYIHVSWASKTPPIRLDDRYYIVHKRFFDLWKRISKYTEFESWQYGAKILYLKYSPHYFYFTSKALRFLDKLAFLTRLGTVGWLLLAHIYYLYRTLRYLLRRDPIWALYFPLIYIRLFKDFRKKVLAWIGMWDVGVYKFLGLDSYENAVRNLKHYGDGLQNFIRLVESRLSRL